MLKNAIDWASRPPRGAAIWGKTAIAGATTGQYGAIWAQQDLRRRVLGIAGARVVDEELPVARAQNAFDESGILTDEHRRAPGRPRGRARRRSRADGRRGLTSQLILEKPRGCVSGLERLGDQRWSSEALPAGLRPAAQTASPYAG